MAKIKELVGSCFLKYPPLEGEKQGYIENYETRRGIHPHAGGCIRHWKRWQNLTVAGC